MNAGQQLGEYIIEAEIGGGGMAKVYRARHAVLDTLHALKVLDAEFRTNAEARRRFLDEAKIQAKHLQHPNIVKVTNIVATADAAALVMELVEGGSLEAFIERRKTPCGTDDFLALAVPILDAIGHAHDAGIIHRDIKPANVLLRKTDGRLVPAITDFGIAKVTDTSGPIAKKHTHHEARMGTLGYISPEQIRKAKDVTTRSDIFSLGAMFYELATGRVPFDGDSDFDIMEKIVHGNYEPPERLADPKLPARICAAIRKALETTPEKRFASCREFSAALTGGKVIAAAGVIASGPVAMRAPSQRRWPLFAALTVGGVALAGGAMHLYTSRADEARIAAEDAAAEARATVVPADAAVPDAAVVIAVPVDAAVVAVAPADAALFVELDPVDAGTPPPPPPRPPRPVAAEPGAVRLSPGVTRLAPATPPAGGTTCRGQWVGSDVRVTIGAGTRCGSISFISGLGDCTGPLVSCVDGSTFSGTYACRFKDVDQGYAGKLTMSCEGNSVAATVFVGGSPKTKYLRRP
jgi:hypothetical protein